MTHSKVLLAVLVSLLCLFFYSNTARAVNPAYPDLTYWEQWALDNAYTISNYVYSEGTTTGQDGEIGNEFICIKDDVNQVIIGRPDVCGTYYSGLGYSFANITTDPTQLTAAPDIIDAVTDNLLDPNLANWGGCNYTGNDYLGGTNPGGPQPNCGQNIINWSYGGYWVYRRHAIEQALQQAGVNVDGYTWQFRIKNLNGDRADQSGTDTLSIYMRIWDKNGNEVHQKNWTYNWKFDWSTFSGTELFANPLVGENLSSWQLQMYGKDSGFWSGYYGPEMDMSNSEINMIYSYNPCVIDSLLHPDCEGYVDAYANFLYDENCKANPLYDSACPGYQQAYYDQQCNINPLYDQGCPNYAQAYYDQQCSFNPLYDTGCTGYAEAYLDYQCSLDALYDTSCNGYEQAYLDYQCSLDALYDSTCEGYAEAYAKEYILNAETTSSTETISTTSETIPSITSAETLTETPLTGDSTVDQILGDLNETPTTTVVMESSTVETMPTVQETQETEREPETSAEAESTGEMEELVADVETETESSDESTTDESTDGDDSESSDESEGKDSDGGDSKSEKKDSKESKREKLKKAITKKAMALADNMSNAASLEAQQAVQAQVLALINYVPDFNKYNTMMNGGYLPDASGYPDTQVPESRRGLRNGLAQQLLHEKMVDMQYENFNN
jgi:hypothetical protein